MSSAEKELEERIAEVGNSLLAPPSDVDELLSLLDGLVAKKLLGHLDEDVKLAVASCISEITRITAPEAPYDDDLMKDIFQKIVNAFEKLDDMSSRSHSKRESILETVAKVRSCVVMLDLECDTLILEMFHHFLRTIRDNHPSNVFSSMEVIMTLVLEESEDISPVLVSTLLMNVKKDATDILPVARRLAEKVIGNCAIKLKPCLMEVVQSSGGQLSDYSKIITTVCEESSDVLKNNGLNASGECVGSGKIESEVSCPEVGTASGRSPKSVMSNGIVQAGNEALAEATTTNKKSGLPKNASASRTEEDKSDLIDVKGTLSENSNKKSKGHKSNSVLQLANTRDNSQIVDEKGDVDLPNRKKGHDKGPDISQSECPPSKEMEPTTQKEHKKGVEPQVSEKFKKDKASVVSPSSNEKLPDTSRPKRGRPPGIKVKKGGAGDALVSSSSSHKARAIEDTDTEVLLSSKKRKEGSKDSDRKPGRRSGKKQSAGSVEDSGKSSSHRKMEVDVGSDEEGMLLRKRRKLHMEVSEGPASGRRQGSKSKLQKSRDSSDNEMVSSPRMAAKGDKDQVILEESKSWKKRYREEVHTHKYMMLTLMLGFCVIKGGRGDRLGNEARRGEVPLRRLASARFAEAFASVAFTCTSIA
ncbi:hypothetical protein Taro_045969 [Colocasia esculenta]|uniref:Uncharacterized protein n=1 Tax=Colocasia esculenta TaxID=4460 RepID=A0A843X4Z2_COLES|nr:hypothetical protein [Colocasia esculenta]